MKILSLASIACCVLPLHAQSSRDVARDKAAVLEAERIGCRAYEQNNVEGVRKFLTDDYTLTDSRGVVTTKQDDLDDFLKNRMHYTTFVNKNMIVRVYPEAAVVIGQTVVRGSAQGKPFDIEVQFTDTLVRLNGEWKLAAGHVSRLHNAASPLNAPITSK